MNNLSEFTFINIVKNWFLFIFVFLFKNFNTIYFDQFSLLQLIPDSHHFHIYATLLIFSLSFTDSSKAYIHTHTHPKTNKRSMIQKVSKETKKFHDEQPKIKVKNLKEEFILCWPTTPNMGSALSRCWH